MSSFEKKRSMDSAKIIGLVAGLLTTISFIPQVIKTWRSKSAKDLSLVMFLLYCAGMLLWTIYGFMLNELPLILWNVITLVLSLVILFFKIKFKD
jgi:MtN3 and saliva related transmembrane protein